MIRASADTTAGAFGIVEEIALLETPPHLHEREDEFFYMLEGEHVFRVGEEEFRVGPGAWCSPRGGIPHSQRRVKPRVGRPLTMVSPAGFEGFFHELSAAESDGTIGPETYTHVSEKYAITWLG